MLCNLSSASLDRGTSPWWYPGWSSQGKCDLGNAARIKTSCMRVAAVRCRLTGQQASWFSLPGGSTGIRRLLWLPLTGCGCSVGRLGSAAANRSAVLIHCSLTVSIVSAGL